MTTKLSRIPELDRALLSTEQVQVLERVLQGRGRVPTPFKIWLQSPKLASELEALGHCLTHETSLSARESKLAILSVAAHWRAEYVFAMHKREALELGIAPDVIEAIAAQATETHLRSRASLLAIREWTLLRLLSALLGCSPVSDEIFDEALNHFKHAGVAEVLALCGYYSSVALVMSLYQAGKG